MTIDRLESPWGDEADQAQRDWYEMQDEYPEEYWDPERAHVQAIESARSAADRIALRRLFGPSVEIR